MPKPTKPCWSCGADAWWLTPDGRYLCGKCHPPLAPDPTTGKEEYSPEVLALRDRVILGNKKLNDAWEQIKAMVRDTEEWSEQVEHWRQANEKLSLLCTELETRGYEDCLYRADQGKRTSKCLDQGGTGCRVCPSKILYWEQELMELPGPKVKQTEHGVEQAKFLKKLGGRDED